MTHSTTTLKWLLTALLIGSLFAPARAIAPDKLVALKRLSTTDRTTALLLSARYLQDTDNRQQRLQISEYRCTALLGLNRYADVQQLYRQYEDELARFPHHQLALGACYASAVDRLGHNERAIKLLKQLHKAVDGEAYPYGMSMVLVALSSIQSYQGLYVDALENLNSGLSLYERSGVTDLHHELHIYNAMANTYKYIGNMALASENYQQALLLAREHKDRLSELTVLNNLASVSIDQDDFDKAIGLALESKRIAIELGDAAGVGYAKIAIATAFAHQGKYQLAISTLDKVAATFHRLKEVDGCATVHLKRATWLTQLHQYQPALTEALEAESHYRQSNSHIGLSRIYNVLADVYRHLGMLEMALQAQDKKIEHLQVIFEQDVQREIAKNQLELQQSLERKKNEILNYKYQVSQAVIDKTQAENQLNQIVSWFAVTLAILVSLMWFRSYSFSNKLRHSAYHDPLTQLPNRRSIMEQLTKLAALSARHQRSFVVAMLDIDHFKKINDTHGHLQGDAVLKLIADALSNQMRSEDSCGRLGGEEFLLLLPETSASQGKVVLERVRHAIEQLQPEGIGQVTASIGYGESHGELPIDKLLSEVDVALYQAKALGRNCSVRVGR